MSTIVVNLYGGPGSGKSTGMAYVFAKLKLAGVNAEMVTEFAKDKVWENNDEVFKCQAYIFGKQLFKIERCLGKVDVIITDSPLLLSAHYGKHYSKNFSNFVYEMFSKNYNVNFLINRKKAYNPKGRFQTEDESDKISEELKSLLESLYISFDEVDGNEDGYNNIVDKVLKLLQK